MLILLIQSLFSLLDRLKKDVLPPLGIEPSTFSLFHATNMWLTPYKADALPFELKRLKFVRKGI
jgi:hypothetical protein